MAVRPKTFSASIAPVLLAGVIAGKWDTRSLILWGCCFVVALALQAAANLANDYYDWKSKLDVPENRLGPTRVTSSGLIAPVLVKLACFACIGLAALVGLFAAWQSSWLILIPGGLCLILAWGYTAGPLPLSYLALGEVSAFIFFGVVPCSLSIFVINGSFSLTGLGSGIMCGLFASAIMAVNNLRDINTDREKGKLTLAVWLGEPKARKVTAFFYLLAFLVPVLIAVSIHNWLLLGSVVVIIPAIRFVNKILDMEISSNFNFVLAGVSATEIAIAILFSIAWLVNGQ